MDILQTRQDVLNRTERFGPNAAEPTTFHSIHKSEEEFIAFLVTDEANVKETISEL